MASNIKDKEESILLHQLNAFTSRHTAHHVPIALVTSGGTAAPLEHNCVRFLDNFSTGTRGAYAVEEFTKRGYAVIHLKRSGSISPFGRILGGELKCGRGGPTFDSLGALFDIEHVNLGVDEEEEEDYYGLLQDIEDVDEESIEEKNNNNNNSKNSDPWMYSNSSNNQHHQSATHGSRKKKRDGELTLNPRLISSPLLQSTLRAYKRIKHQGLLLTMEFRTVEDYLTKLQYCCEAINTCGSLGLVYLAAAVSDFYVPDEKKALHKIQSRDYGIKSQASSAMSASSFGTESSSTSQEDPAENTLQIQSDNTLKLTLYPVPKVIPFLRHDWCPNAFVISFKLETDISILRQKAVMAMERYNVNMVIGNELNSRYEKVFVLSRKQCDDDFGDDITNSNKTGDETSSSDLPEGFQIAEVTSAHGLAMVGPTLSNSPTSNVDALEYATIEYVVRRHFHFISTNMNSGDATANKPPNMSAAELAANHTLRASSLHEKRLKESNRQLQRERLKARVAELAWNVAGSALGMALSYGVARILQGRQQALA